MAHCAERAGHVQGENRTQKANVRGRCLEAPHVAEASRGRAEDELFGEHRKYNLTFGSMHDRLECNVPDGRGQEQRAQSSVFLL